MYNVGLGREVSDDEIFRAVRDALGSPIEATHADFRPGEVRRIALDASRIRRDLGWAPAFPLEEGMRTVAAHYRSLSA